MALEGVDYSWARPTPADLYKAGKRFAVRYLSWGSSGRGNSILSGASNGKVLTKSEADRLQAAGLAVVSNWEFRTDDQLRGRDGGRFDAREADRLHLDRGGPAEAPIYFSTDFDASTTQLATCYEYLRGCADILGWDRVGVYGGYRTIAYMHGRGVKWLWQTYAWSGGRWHPGAQLQQYKNGVKVAGADVDLNRATAMNFGQWAATKEDDDMGWDEKINLITGQGVSYEGDKWKARFVLASDHYYTLKFGQEIRAEQAAAKLRDEAILKAIKGVDTKAILSAIDTRAAEDASRDAVLMAEAAAAVKAALPSVEELAAAVAAAVDHDLDTAAVAAALREVLGGIDEVGE